MAAAATPAAECSRASPSRKPATASSKTRFEDLFSSQKVYDFIRPMKTVGVIAAMKIGA
jgi:hypothetical protein